MPDRDGIGYILRTIRELVFAKIMKENGTRYIMEYLQSFYDSFTSSFEVLYKLSHIF